MDKMKNTHVENHNMIEVHYDTANMQKRDWNLKLYLYRRFMAFSFRFESLFRLLFSTFLCFRVCSQS